MKNGASRKRRIIGLVGLAAMVLAGLAILSMGARIARSSFGPNSAQFAEMQVEWAEIHSNQIEQQNSQRAEAIQNSESAEVTFHDRSGHDFHRHSFHGRGEFSHHGYEHGHGHRGFSLLGAMFGGLINLTVLGLAGYGIYSLYKRWTTPESAAPQARVIEEDDDDDIGEEIKVG